MLPRPDGRLLRNGGQTVLLNHADAPGSGEPAEFRLRELPHAAQPVGQAVARRRGASAHSLGGALGRPQARSTPAAFAALVETANLVFGESAVELLDALDLPEVDAESDAEDFRTVLELITDYSGSGNMFMVTHPENLAVWLGIRSRAGEAVIGVQTRWRGIARSGAGRAQLKSAASSGPSISIPQAFFGRRTFSCHPKRF